MNIRYFLIAEMFGWNFTSSYILINLKRLWSHLLLLPCWNIQNLLYNYVNTVFCMLPASLNSLFFRIHPLKLHAFTSKLLLNMISMSVQTLNSPFFALNAHLYNHAWIMGHASLLCCEQGDSLYYVYSTAPGCCSARSSPSQTIFIIFICSRSRPVWFALCLF